MPPRIGELHLRRTSRLRDERRQVYEEPVPVFFAAGEHKSSGALGKLFKYSRNAIGCADIE
jgi:hypothetical protein